jgi:hypothetical protein
MVQHAIERRRARVWQAAWRWTGILSVLAGLLVGASLLSGGAALAAPAAAGAAAAPVPTTPSGPATAPVASSYAGGFAARGADGSVYFNAAPGHASWTQMPGPTLKITTTPVMAQTSDGNLWAVARASNGTLYYRFLASGNTAWSNWFSTGFTTNFAPAMASSGTNFVVAATGTDGHVYTWFYTGSGPIGWRAVDTTTTWTTAPAVSLVGGNDDYAFIAARGTDGNLYLNQGYADTGAWVGWQSLHFATDYAPTASSYTNHTTSPDTEESVLAAVGTDGRVYYDYWTLGGGGSWVLLDPTRTTSAPVVVHLDGNSPETASFLALGSGGKVFTSDTPVASGGGQSTGWSWAPCPAKRVTVSGASSGNQSILVARDTFGHVWVNEWTLGGAGVWTDIPGTKTFVGTPHVVLDGGWWAVVAVDSAKVVWWSGNGAGWSVPSTPPGTIVMSLGAPAVVISSGCALIVYTGTDGHLYTDGLASSCGTVAAIDNSFVSTTSRAATAVGTNQDYVFVAARGNDGNLYLNQGYPSTGTWVGWQSLGFATGYAPAASSSAQNSVLVATGTDGHVYYNDWTLGGTGTGWTPVDTSFVSTGSPAASLVGGNNNYLFVAAPGANSQLYLNQGYVSGTFIGWARI